MSLIFSDHLDGPNATDLAAAGGPGANCSYTQRGLSGTGTTAQFDTSTSALGTSSAKAVQGASFSSVAFYTPTLGTAITTVYQRLCYRFSVLPTGGSLYISQVLDSTGAIVARLAVNSSGKLALYAGTTLATTGTTTLATNTWYRFEWDLVGTTMTLRLYGSPTSTTVVETLTATIAGTAFVRFMDGIPASGNSNLVTLNWDEVARDSASNPGPVTGTPASSSGSLGFSGATTSSLAASSTGSLGFAGASQARTAGGKIAGLVDSFAGTVIDTSKWYATNGATQNNAAILPSSAAGAALTSAQVWDATGSVIFVSIVPPASGQGDLKFDLVDAVDATKLLRVSVATNTLLVTLLDGVADPSPVSRAVTNRDNVIRVLETGGTITVAVRERNSPTWITLRTVATPTWWGAVLVKLSSTNGSTSGASAVFTNLNVAPTTPSGHQPTSTLADDFTGTSLTSSRWLVSGPGTLTVHDDVEIAAATADKTQVTSVDTFSLDVANIRVVRAATNASGDYTTFKLLSPTAGTEARFTMTNGNLSAEYRVGDVQDPYTVTIAHDNSQSIYLQFSADLPNNNLVWSYSFDGINYAVLRTSPLPYWYTGVQIAFATKAA